MLSLRSVCSPKWTIVILCRYAEHYVHACHIQITGWRRPVSRPFRRRRGGRRTFAKLRPCHPTSRLTTSRSSVCWSNGGRSRPATSAEDTASLRRLLFVVLSPWCRIQSGLLLQPPTFPEFAVYYYYYYDVVTQNISVSDPKFGINLWYSRSSSSLHHASRCRQPPFRRIGSGTITLLLVVLSLKIKHIIFMKYIIQF